MLLRTMEKVPYSRSGSGGPRRLFVVASPYCTYKVLMHAYLGLQYVLRNCAQAAIPPPKSHVDWSPSSEALMMQVREGSFRRRLACVIMDIG